VFTEVLSVAREHDLSAYDAAYLELALRKGLPLATLDTRLRNAARRAGVELFA
jgi:predicted nucleic acid-binding protein